MKRANGTGSVEKMSGKRRRPYRAVVTVRCYLDLETMKAKKERVTIGYFHTRPEAEYALATYLRMPYDLSSRNLTFKEAFEKWFEEHSTDVAERTAETYKSRFEYCSAIHNRRMKDLTLDDLQAVLDTSGKNAPTQRIIKLVMRMVYDWAVLHDVVSREQNKVEFLKINATNPDKRPHERFTPDEIKILWDNKDTAYCNVILMMIYSGVRISELLDLKKEDVNLEEHYFNVVKSKTESGVRIVPIADKVYTFFEYWYNLNDCEYLISNDSEKHLPYYTFYNKKWLEIMENFGMSHRPHDTRHTCISLLTEKLVDARLIKAIVGHRGSGITEAVYTHFSTEVLLEAINKI